MHTRASSLARLFVLVVATVAGAAGTARAATVIWGGGTGSGATAANWIGGSLPTSTDTASFTGWEPMPRSGWTVTALVGAGPSGAIDGAWNTRWTTSTASASGQWFRIDLGSTQTFSRLVMDTTGDNNDYPNGFDIYVSSDGSTWGSSVASGAGSAALTTIDFPAQTARYVKVQLNVGGSNWWSIHELFLYTTARADDTQLARNGWTVSASLNSAAVGNAIDSTLSTRWDSGTDASAGDWFKVDLGAPTLVDRIDLSSYTSYTDYPPTYKVQLSTDDVTYGASVATGSGLGFTIATFTAQTARYLLVTCTSDSSYYWSIHDVNVYGTPRAATFSSSATIGGLTLGKGTLTQGTGASLALSGSYAQTGGSFTGSNSAFSTAGAFTLSGGTFTAGTGSISLSTTLDVTGGTLTVGSGAATVSGAATISGGGVINGGTSPNLKFNSTLAIGNGTAGTFNANSAATTFTGAVTLQSGGAFNGNTGSGTFQAAPTLTSGTFTPASAGSAGRWTFAQSTTFSSGVTLALPTAGGELSLSPTKVLTLNGPVTSNVGAASTLPKIDCNGCTAAQGISVAFGATSTLNLNGLELDNVVAAGVSIANGATYTLLKRLKFLNNRGGATSTHLSITLGTGLLNVPGCYFDATAAYNVTLYGTAAAPGGARAIFERQSTATNGAGSGNTFDRDGDTGGDNVGENPSTAPYYGSVVEWVNASQTDTSGVAVGFPTPAFDWNTFAYYGVYVAYKDTTGAATADVLWRRNDDGSPAFSYSVPQSTGDIVGTPFWDTVNEVTAHVDANGNGNQTDTDVRVVYIATTLGHVIKLVDNASSFARPAAAPWSSDFTSAAVTTISSPLVEDGTNLYFGGKNGSGAPSVFGVQVAGGANEKTLQRTIGAVSLITTTPTLSAYSGSTYAFMGSTATSGQAYVYRANMASSVVNGSFSGVVDSVNDSTILVSNRAYAVTDGGTLHVLDASNFATGAFKNLSGFPYQSASAQPIKMAPWVDDRTSYAYFGDNGGTVHVVTNTGGSLTGFPFLLSSAIQVSSSPIYLAGSGVIAVGANDGYLYFVDRHDATNTPHIFRRFFVTSGGSVSTVSYDNNTATYLVSSSDGKLVFINASDVVDPTPAYE